MNNKRSNPLLELTEFVDYSEILPDDVFPAVETAIKKAKEQLEKTLSGISNYRSIKDSLTFNGVIFPIIEAEQIVGQVWGPVNNLLSLNGTPELRNAADKARPLVVNFNNDVVLDPRIFELFSIYSESSEGKTLKGEKQRFIYNTLRDLKLAGAALSDDKKAELRELNLKIAELARKFTDNVTDSKFELILTKEDELMGLPEDFVVASKRKADLYREKLGEEKIPSGACIINLDFPSYVPFMRYSDRGDLRKEMSFQYMQQGTVKATRGLLAEANENSSLDNQQIIKDICDAKARKAKLLGFKNFAEVSITPKMAIDPQQVMTFLEALAVKAKPVAQKELQALVEFQNSIGYKNTEGRYDKVFPWDRDYLSEKFKKAKFDFNSAETKPYFELRQTIDGMFSIIKKLFAVSLVRTDEIPTWHNDVEVYKVEDESGKRLGTLYFDLYPRDTKNQGAWVNPLKNSHIDSNDKIHSSQCVLVCNLTPPSPDKPSLLSSEEATTLFHEMGHALHQVLSTVTLDPLSGLNVAYDFVELPSQLFENFCTEEISLKTFAKHYEDKSEIPQALIDKMKRAENFLAGIIFMRQLEFGLFDMSIYTKEDTKDLDVDKLFENIVSRYGVFDYWKGTHFPCSFSHIFGGGYSAGYYSYKWSEVLEADAFTRFKEAGVLSASVGKEYKEKILAKGDSEDPMKLFVDFMGREPREDALLKRLDNTI